MNTVVAPASPVDPKSLKTFAEFYPFYLSEHGNRTCRRLHFVGSTLALACLATALWTGSPVFILYGLLCGYGFAWVGHFVFEKNRPASFGHPFYSLASDWGMWWEMLTGKVPFSGRLASA